MFSEILKIKPVLDEGSAKKMEESLSKRFKRVAKTFGGGLTSVLKGTVVGISLGLLNRLLNPIEALEDKIKSLLGQGTDIREVADRFNTSPGQIKRLQDVANSLGVQPDQLKEMMLKYAQAVETARRELQDPFVQPSEQTQAVRGFVGEKDLAEGFFRFLQSLKVEGMGQGRDIFLSERERQRAAQRAASGEQLSAEERASLQRQGLVRRATGMESREDFERLVFGEQLFGAQKKLVDTDFGDQFKKLNEPSANSLSSRINKLADLADQQRMLQTKNDTRDMMQGAANMNPKMIADMEAARALEQSRLTSQLKSYDDLRRAADGIEEAKKVLMDMSQKLTQGVGYLGQIISWISTKVEKSPLFRGLFKGGN